MAKPTPKTHLPHKFKARSHTLGAAVRKIRDTRPLLVIMLKEPAMGRVKTRLAREVGASAATRFSRYAAASIIARLARDRRWRTVLAVAPRMALASRIWPAAGERVGQGNGDLGARMRRLLTPSSRPAMLIGADIPAVSAPLIATAFQILRRHDVVFGPAEDGGYWLVGLNRSAPRGDLFTGVRWSTPFALADTLANAARTAARIGYAARLSDVDDAQSYRRCGELAARITLPVASRAGW